MRFRSVGLGMAGLMLAIARGCGGGRDPSLPDLMPVSGTVTLDGEPLANALITFLPVGSTRGQSCYGVTDPSGRYELMENERVKGAPEGEFSVLVNKWVMPDGSDFPRDSTVSAMDAGAVELLPPRYSAEGLSQLTATVTASGGTIDFELTSK